MFFFFKQKTAYEMRISDWSSDVCSSDYAKIYALNALLLPEEVVVRAARLYRDHDIRPFAGGILFEYAYRRRALDELLALLRRLELPGFELSENYVTLQRDERHRLIER